MGLFSWLGKMTAAPPSVTFSESAPKPIDQMFMEMGAGGTTVTRAEALSVPAVQKGRNLLCSIATLPLSQLDTANRPARNPLLEQFDTDVPNVVHLAQTVEDLVFESIAWWRITEFGFDGYPMTVRRLDPGSVSLTPPGGRTPAPLPSGEDPRSAVVYVDGAVVPASQVIRFDSPNPAVLKVCGRAIRRAVRFDKAAERYAQNPRPLDYFSPTQGEPDPASDEEIKEILSNWKQARQTETTAYVPAALGYNTVNTPSPADLQLVELQKQVGLDLANALGVDPEDLGISTTSRTYANAVDRRVDRINDVLSPYMRAITDRLSMGDVTKRGYRVAFNLDDYMKSNPTERWAVYEAAKNLGVMDVAEIRKAEGLPLKGGPSTEEEPTVTESVDADAPAAMHFDADQTEHTFSFTAEEADHTFAADTVRRTVAGVALPYNKITVKYGMKFRFKPGSIEYADVSRVKHYKDHVTPVGRALSIKDSRQALTATLSVANGATGDELLQLAEDGVYDGLSVGVDFSLDPESGDVQLARDGVYDVLRASLREISSTPMPSFDDARLTKVVASRTPGGNSMTETTSTPQPPAADPAPAPAATFSAEQIDALRSALGLPAPVAPAAPQPERPVVNPTRITASVTEAAPYRFDGKGNLRAGGHDFSTDLYAFATSRDQAAHDRALEFIQAQFDVASGDVNELNPTTNRPDMYVDQRQYRYPVWEAINKGSLDSITPFTFPKFNSASGLVGDHTEGVEPTSGTLTTTNQTVTPTPVSGKAKITRVVWDQGGNPQVSNLIWQKMVQGWYEALEAAAVAALDGVTPTAIALTTAAADDALVDELTEEFALLQFVRGGFSMDNLFTHVDLYKALVAAKDTTGRKLLPALGVTNGDGSARARWAALDINGVIAHPAWALGASGTVSESSYLFDSGSVHGWASAPQRLDITLTEVANVYIGLWGYKATAVSDLAGVREVTYDPAA